MDISAEWKERVHTRDHQCVVSFWLLVRQALPVCRVLASRNTPAQDLGVGAGLEGRRFAFVNSVKYTHTASNDL